MEQKTLIQKSDQFWVTRKLKAFAQKIFKIDDSPEKIARGFALGTFIGMTPFIGIQLPISVSIAQIFKWNKFAAGVAVFNTNVFTGTFIFGINYLIGSALIGEKTSFNFSSGSMSHIVSAIIDSGYSFFLSLFIGGIITGIPSALIAYVLVRKIFQSKLIQVKILKTKSHGIAQ